MTVVRASAALLALLLEGVALPAQTTLGPFLRGDSNSDGRVDITDALYLQAFLFNGGRAPLCYNTGDVNDNSALNFSDSVVLVQFLSYPGLASGCTTDDDPIVIEEEDQPCAYPQERCTTPIEPQAGPPFFDLSFEGPLPRAEDARLADFTCIVTTREATGDWGALGWSLSIRPQGCRIVEATTSGLTYPAPQSDSIFSTPFKNTVLIGGGAEGVVSVLFSYPDPSINLHPADSPHTLLRLTVELDYGLEDCAEASLAYEDGLQVNGHTVENIFSYWDAIDIRSYRPSKTPLSFRLCRSVPFHRGDANGDGALDISDAIRILAWLFSGDDGFGCIEAADADNSGVIQITDGIVVVEYLFLGAPGPAPPAPSVPCGGDPDPRGSDRDLGCREYGGC